MPRPQGERPHVPLSMAGMVLGLSLYSMPASGWARPLSPTQALHFHGGHIRGADPRAVSRLLSPLSIPSGQANRAWAFPPRDQPHQLPLCTAPPAGLRPPPHPGWGLASQLSSSLLPPHIQSGSSPMSLCILVRSVPADIPPAQPPVTHDVDFKPSSPISPAT